MTKQDLLKYKVQLNSRLDAVETEKAKIVREIKAVDVLLEGHEPSNHPSPANKPKEVTSQRQTTHEQLPRKSPPHAIRVSPRSSLIGAVQEVALRQPGDFDSGQLLKALQSAYPEFHLTETKHISSPLSDLVKRGVLNIQSRRIGSRPNIYKAPKNGSNF
jgi:hypothetical protein